MQWAEQTHSMFSSFYLCHETKFVPGPFFNQEASVETTLTLSFITHCRRFILWSSTYSYGYGYGYIYSEILSSLRHGVA